MAKRSISLVMVAAAALALFATTPTASADTTVATSASSMATGTATTATTTTTTTPSPSVRSTMWIVGDPHVYSVNKGYQYCAIGASQNCLNTGLLSISCSDGAIKNSDGTASTKTALKSLTLTFTSGSTTQTYTASDSTKMLATTLDSGANAALISTSLWLYVKSIVNTTANGITTTSVLITDYKSNSTVSIVQWSGSVNSLYMLFVRTQENQLTSATGLLVSGCSSRRRRQVAETRTGTTDCGTGTSSDASMSAATLSTICSTDTAVDSSLASAVASSVTVMNSVRTADASTFSAGESKFAAVAATLGFLVACATTVFNSFQ